MAYADYTYYKTIYKGTAVPESRFDAAAERASELLDEITCGRITDGWTEYDGVKRACCALAERQYSLAQRGGADIRSESVGSRSVTYAEQSGTGTGEAAALAARYLGKTGLLYRGVYRNDDKCGYDGLS